MFRSIKLKRLATLLLAVVFLFATLVPSAEAQRRRRRPSKTKNIAVGTAIGAVGGALIGGKKGALIGAGAGAAGGYGVYKYKKRKARRSQ